MSPAPNMSVSTDEVQPLLPANETHVKQVADDVQQSVPPKQTCFSIARAIGALQEGKMPSQEQIDKLLDAFVNSDVLKSSSPHSRTVRLSDQGARNVEDIKELIVELRHWGDEKNSESPVIFFRS